MSFTVYRSSAGSGKTHTLVKEYLNLVLRNPEVYRNILAITFTNKAANEMRERILNALRHLSDPRANAGESTIKHMLPDLLETTGLDEKTLTDNAAKVLHDILHNYEDFSVSTIDSFIHRIIRTFAFDLHLPLNFEVELDEQAMVGMAVDMLLGQVGVEPVTTDVLLRFAASRIDDEKNWDIEKDLRKFARKLLRDDIAEHLPLLESMNARDILKASELMNISVRKFEKEITDKAKGLVATWSRNDITQDDLYYARNGVFGFVSKLAGGNFSTLENKNARKTLDEGKWASSKPGPAKLTVIEKLSEDMGMMLRDIIEHIEKGKPQYVLYKLLRRNIYPLAVLAEIDAVLQQIRQAESIIHISEFDKRIAMVVENEPVPFIYERLGDRYHHFLIDEFQDTSVLEWQNILPLIENSLGEAHFNMLVGDPKQAIYRFKGGEVEQLVKLPSIHKRPDTPEMLMREKQLGDHYNGKQLRKNFRSASNIIAFNNAIYAHLGTSLPESLQGIYEDCRQEIPNDKTGGEVRIRFLDAGGNMSDREPLYFEHIREYIGEMTSPHGYKLKDIAILTRSNASASKIARNLLLGGIPVVSAESLLLSSSPGVNFLVSSLDLIANREDRLAMAVMINFITSQKSNSPHSTLAQVMNGGEKQMAFDRFRDFLGSEGIAFDPAMLSQMGLYERVEELVRVFVNMPSPDPYVSFFLDLVFEYAGNVRLPDEDFTAYWRENSHKFSVVVPEGLDAVNVMTIHKAKGLEFPVVIFPFANSRVDNSRNQVWIPIREEQLPGLKAALVPLSSTLEDTDYEWVYREEQEKALLDMLNIMYVATTRPTRNLFIICDKPPADKTDINNIPACLKSYLESEGQWEEAKNEYNFGEPAMAAEGKELPLSMLSLGQFISGDWRQYIRLSGRAADRWDLNDEKRNMAWGNLVHNILSSIRSGDELEEVLRKESLKGNLREDEMERIGEVLRSLLQMEELKMFFNDSYEIKNEITIMDEGGREYRPDRVMISGSKAIVLDYKTGKEDPSHLRQVNLYGQLLGEMGFREVEEYLLYIDDPCRLVRA